MKEILTSLKFLFLLTIVCGVAYPMLIAGVGALSPHPRGDLQLIGQNFTKDIYFHGRPAAATQLEGAPAELTTPSASGLDPHISKEAALYQVPRIAKARKVDEATLNQLIDAHVEPAFLGVFGREKINVLTLNIALDATNTAD